MTQADRIDQLERQVTDLEQRVAEQNGRLQTLEQADAQRQPYLDVAGVCQRYGVSATSIYRWTSDDEIGFPHFRLPGGELRFDHAQVDGWFKSGRGSVVPLNPRPRRTAQ